jgi:integrase
MVAGTLYHRRRFVARFDAYRAPGQPLALAVPAWLATLPASQQFSAKIALKAHLGKAAMDWDAVSIVKYRRNEPRLAASVLKEAHRTRLREVADTRERALIGVLYTARRGEVAAMRWGHVDLGTGTVYIPCGKGGKAGQVYLTQAAQADLAAWFTEAGSPPDAAPVFTKTLGRPYTPTGIGHLVQRLLMRAGLWSSGIGSAHRMRRTFASEYLRNNRHDLVGLQRLLRHSEVNTSASYCYLEPDDLAPRVAQLGL